MKRKRYKAKWNKQIEISNLLGIRRCLACDVIHSEKQNVFDEVNFWRNINIFSWLKWMNWLPPKRKGILWFHIKIVCALGVDERIALNQHLRIHHRLPLPNRDARTHTQAQAGGRMDGFEFVSQFRVTVCHFVRYYLAQSNFISTLENGSNVWSGCIAWHSMACHGNSIGYVLLRSRTKIQESISTSKSIRNNRENTHTHK